MVRPILARRFNPLRRTNEFYQQTPYWTLLVISECAICGRVEMSDVMCLHREVTKIVIIRTMQGLMGETLLVPGN